MANPSHWLQLAAVSARVPHDLLSWLAEPGMLPARVRALCGPAMEFRRLGGLRESDLPTSLRERLQVDDATCPIARALAGNNEVWGAARLRSAADREKLTGIGLKPVALDLSAGDFSSLPDDFSYVFHAAVDPGRDGWPQCVRTNAHCSGDLLFHCRAAKGFVFCSTGSIYAYQGQRPLTESDPPGVPLRANYSFSKVAAESVCTWGATRFGIPLTIIRVCSTYGPLGGAPADRLEAILQRRPIRVHPDKPNNYNPIYEDDPLR